MSGAQDRMTDHDEDPRTTVGADGLDSHIPISRILIPTIFLCSLLFSLLVLSPSPLLDRTFPGIQRELIFREAARTHGGAPGPEKKMAPKTSGSRPSPGSRRASSVILTTWQVSLYFAPFCLALPLS